MKKIMRLNKRFVSFFLAVMMIYSMAFTGIKVSATTTGLTVSVNDSSNQSIPQYTNSGGSRIDTIFNSNNSVRNTPVRLSANAMAKISYNFTNANTAKYQFVQASDLTTVPQFPQDSIMTNINLPAPNSQAAYSNDIGNQGTISTMQYVYAGNPGSASTTAQLTRDASFGTPLSSTMLVQNATVSSDIPYYTVSGSNAFFSGTTTSNSNTILSKIEIYSSSSSSTKNSTYYVKNGSVYRAPTANAAWKSMKFWGYFKPINSGYYNLGAWSDDGAYGYIIKNGQQQVFVDDWSIADAFPRTKNNVIWLDGGSYYPMYMEWYEGNPTRGAFTPVFKYDPSNSSNTTIGKSDTVTLATSPNATTSDKLISIPQNYFYSSKTTTPGTIPGAYFGDVSGIPFPTQDGIYYIATKFISGEGTTSGSYGPFIIDKTPPTISILSVTSDNSSDNKKAGVGNTLTINFKASETLQANPQISLDGYVANATSYTKTSDNSYTATVKIASDGSINSSGDKITQTGSINVKIGNYSDLSGNVGLPVQDSSVIFVNATGITLTLTQNTTALTNGNVTITANASASGSGNSIKTIKYATGNQSVNYFTAGGTSIYDSASSGSKSTVQSTFNVNTNGVYTVYSTDSNGNVAVQTIDVENIFVAAPVITGPINGTVTNSNTPTITGTAEANSKVKVYDGATLIGTVNTDGSGNWTLIPATALSDGTHTITATATNAAGNVSLVSNAVNITIDKTPPTLILSQSPTASTNGTVTITATATDNVAVASITNPDNTVVTGSSTTYAVSANGTYTFTATDTAGNTTSQSININNIVISSTNDTSFPNISASLKSVSPNPAKSSDEISVKYGINTVPFSLASGTIDEAEVLVDMSQGMKNNQRFSELQNGFVNQVINDSNLSGIKLGVVGYNNSVYIGTRSNYSDPKSCVMKQTDENLSNIDKTNFLPLYNLNDANTKDGYRQFYQNGYIYNSISSDDQRQFGSALKAADKVLTNYGTSGAKKAIIIISSGNLTYSDAQINSIIGKGYKIIVLDISNSDTTNIKDTYIKLCGNDFGIAGNYYKGTLNDGVNYNSVDADMKNVDTSLKGLTGVTTLSINNAKLNIDLGENFKAIDGGGLEGSGKVRTVTIPQMNFIYDSTTGQWKQERTIEVTFKVKSESGKNGELGFGVYTNTNNTTNTNSSTISYTNFYNIVTNKIIETPTINITIDRIVDTTGPTLTLVASPTNPTSGRVTITAETTDGGSGVSSITNVTATDGKIQGTVTNPANSTINSGIVTNSDGTLISGSTITYTVSANGTYEFIAKDNAGNTTTKSIDINNITATVQGTVVDATTHNPISGITVSVVSDGGTKVSTNTDSDGKYSLNNITAPSSGVQVTITTSANDYITQSSTKTLVGRIDPYGQDFALINTYVPSIISKHGLYNGNGTSITEEKDLKDATGNPVTTGIPVTDKIPVTLAMIVEANSSNLAINLSTNTSKVTQGTIEFKMYKISDSDNGRIDTNVLPTVVSLNNNGNINLTGLTMERGHKYLIVYTITPYKTTSDKIEEVNVTATADGTNTKSANLNILAQPDLF